MHLQDPYLCRHIQPAELVRGPRGAFLRPQAELCHDPVPLQQKVLEEGFQLDQDITH